MWMARNRGNERSSCRDEGKKVRLWNTSTIETSKIARKNGLPMSVRDENVWSTCVSKNKNEFFLLVQGAKTIK